jgi:hypothetical protein
VIGEAIMRRFLPLVSVVVIALIGVVAFGAQSSAGAQDATPVIEAMAEGVTVEELAVGSVPSYPLLPADIALYRVQIAPGGRIVTPPDDAGLGLVYVESGTLVARRTVAAVVTRGAAMATPGAQAQEEIPANTEVTLRAGDFYLAPPMSGGEVRNDGTEEVVILDIVVSSAIPATPAP